MKVSQYISKKVKEVEKKHKYQCYLNSADSELRRQYKAYENNANAEWQSIKNNEDVLKRIKYFDNVVRSVESNVGNWHIEDSFNMALAFHKALKGLEKLSISLDRCSFIRNGFTAISKAEADEIFERLDSIATRMDEQNLLRIVRD